jgi:hypothetical protein
MVAGAGLAVAESDLGIAPEDVRIAAREDGGYDLYVRTKPDIASILLTETTKDPAMKADNFAYRAVDYNSVNGDEKRLLNGKVLPPQNKLYSLISSTPLPDAGFGQSFRILIPPVLVYGYAWSRSGTVAVGKGTFINIRAFAKPYADYGGAFKDNPYQIRIATKPNPPASPPAPPQKPQQPAPAPKPKTPPEAKPQPVDDRTSSKLDALIEEGGQSLDLVVCLDTTESMVPYIDDLKKNLPQLLRKRVSLFKEFRIGIVLFRDYWPDDYITLKYPFTSDIDQFEKTLKGAKVAGGRDIPEAEFEALYSAATEFEWKAERRQVILVSDAPPHPDQRGKISFADVIAASEAQKIEADDIIEPTSITPPNPPHLAFENETKRLAIRAAKSGPAKVLACVQAPRAKAADLAALRDESEKELKAEMASQGPGVELAGPVFAADGADDARLLEQAREAGAAFLIVAKEERLGALSETIARLIEVQTGKEIGRDVVWTARRVSGGQKPAIFANGLRSQ